MDDFSFYAGDKKLVTITVLDANDAAVNLTGAAIRWHAARSTEDETVLEKTTDSPAGIVITDPTAGVFVVTLDEADTDDLIGIYYHEAEIEISSDISTVISGHFYVIRTLIRAA